MLYRQMTAKLRVQGRSPETSVRLREEKPPWCWHDEPCSIPGHKHPTDLPPTLIELVESDPVDLEFLLRIGAIVPWEPPQTSRTRKARSEDGEIDDG